MAVSQFEAEFIEVKQLTDPVFEYAFRIPQDFTFTPGQFVSIDVGNMLRRSYSILSAENGIMLLLVDISPGGPGSRFFINLKPGDKVKMLGPLGLFTCKDTNVEKVFIATGTGIAPFVPMIKEIKATKPYVKMRFYFGTRFIQENLAYNYLDDVLQHDQFTLFRCISRKEDPTDQACLDGRVTKVMPETITDYSNKEFYICGVNKMIDDVRTLLLEKNVEPSNILYEKYG